jgi:hypothetical protein
LAEVTVLAAYRAGGTKGMVMTNGDLAEGSLTQWWRKSTMSNRSGIGESRQDRHKLQGAVSQYEREHHADLVEAVENITGHQSDGDVFQAVTGYLVRFEAPTSLGEKAEDLTKAVEEFLAQVRRDADDITDSIQTSHP